VKVSAGLAFKIPIIKIINMAQFEEILKEKGFWIYASDMEGIPYYENEYSEKSAIVFGNEGKGVRRLVKERSDRLISIPMEDTVDSLNVAASAAIILFDRRRQLTLGGE
jgi:23S rRNA (guanosine2251-2'-O)-methyltransferase